MVSPDVIQSLSRPAGPSHVIPASCARVAVCPSTAVQALPGPQRSGKSHWGRRRSGIPGPVTLGELRQRARRRGGGRGCGRQRRYLANGVLVTTRRPAPPLACNAGARDAIAAEQRSKRGGSPTVTPAPPRPARPLPPAACALTDTSCLHLCLPLLHCTRRYLVANTMRSALVLDPHVSAGFVELLTNGTCTRNCTSTNVIQVNLAGAATLPLARW
jgi:hypothetical protein